MKLFIRFLPLLITMLEEALNAIATDQAQHTPEQANALTHASLALTHLKEAHQQVID